MLAWLKRLFELPPGYDHATGLSREDRRKLIEPMIAQWQRAQRDGGTQV